MKHYLRNMFILIITLFSIQTLQAQRLQAIHAVSDPELSLVDAYIQASIITIKIEDIAYRTATSVVDVPFAGIPIKVGIAPGNSTSINDTVTSLTATFSAGITYLGVPRGVLNPAQFAPNPEGLDISLSFNLLQGLKEASSVTGQVEVLFAHTVTDAPTVDLRDRSGDNVANDIAFGEISGYTTLTPTNHVLEIKTADGATVVAAFDADLSAYADSAMVIVASGFLDPSANQNGPGLALQGVLPGGTVIDFPVNPTGIEDDGPSLALDYTLEQNYPNPFNPSTTVAFTLPVAEAATVTVYNAAGQQVATLLNKHLPAGRHQVEWDAATYPSGLYFYRLQTSQFQQTKKMMLLK